MIELRAYGAALDALQPLKDSPDEVISSLAKQVINLVDESRFGRYDFHNIKAEVERNPRVRLTHADYCSSLITLGKSKSGGESGRGIFAKEEIPPGTLLIASKAVACLYFDELVDTRQKTSSPPVLTAAGWVAYGHVCLTKKLDTMISEKGCGRSILNLEGGEKAASLDIDLLRDDIYEEPVSTTV